MRISDWSSDVCSSDQAGQEGLGDGRLMEARAQRAGGGDQGLAVGHLGGAFAAFAGALRQRFHEQRVRQRTGARVGIGLDDREGRRRQRSEEHTSELPSLMRISYAVFCFKTTTLQHNNYK